MPYDTTFRDSAVREVLDQVKREGRTALTAPEGKRVCDAYGIGVPGEGLARSAEEAAKIASELGFPVVMKIVSPDILHKTEAGGVVVGVKSAAEAETAFGRILANTRTASLAKRCHGPAMPRGAASLDGSSNVKVGTPTPTLISTSLRRRRSGARSAR